jgi:hypothetical protein
MSKNFFDYRSIDHHLGNKRYRNITQNLVSELQTLAESTLIGVADVCQIGLFSRGIPIGDQDVDVDVHVRESKLPHLLNLELSPKIVYLLKLAEEREKETEAMQSLK